MKNTTKLVLSLGLIAAPLALSAKSLEQTYLESYAGRTDMPVPLTVVKPVVPADYAGLTVELEFTIDATGRPGGITARNSADADLVETLSRALAKWTFEPLRRDGRVVATRVVLPVRIVDGLSSAKRFAAN